MKEKRAKKLFSEFTAFLKRGNVVDLAVGIVVGGAFQKIVTSLVKDIIMPLLSLIGGKNLAESKYVFKAAVIDAAGVVTTPEVALYWGSFVQSIIDFFIIALAIFVAIKAMSAVRKVMDKQKEFAKDLIEKLDKKDDEKQTETETEGTEAEAETEKK